MMATGTSDRASGLLSVFWTLMRGAAVTMALGLFAARAEAQIQTEYLTAYDKTTKPELTNTVTSTSWSHPVTKDAGVNTTIAVVTLAASVNITVSSITYNGTNMIEVYKVGGAGGYTGIYYVRAPTNNGTIAVSWDSSAYLVASSFTLVNVRTTGTGGPITCPALDPTGTCAADAGGALASTSDASGNVYLSRNQGDLVTNTIWFSTASVVSASVARLDAGQPKTPAEDAYLNGSGSAVSGAFAAGAAKYPQMAEGEFLAVTFSWKARDGSGLALVNAPSTITLVQFRGANGLTAIQMDGLEAQSTRAGNLVRWRTGWEVANLGFSVWRQVDGVKTRVTPSILAGSALIVGPRAAMTAGRTYRWVDRGFHDQRATYWVEEIALNGKRTWHGPILPGPADPDVDETVGSSPAGETTRLLTDLASCEASTSNEPGIPAIVSTEPRLDSLALDEANLKSVQQKLAAGEAVKLAVAREGWYRVSQETLVAAGLDPQADAKSLHLYSEGEEEPLLVTRSSRSNRDGSGPYVLEFYGRPLDTPWSGTRIYWLAKGNSRSLRIITGTPGAGGSASPPSFPYTVERRDRSVYWVNLTNNGDEASFFGAAVLGTENTEQELEVSGLGTPVSSTYPLAVSLQGVTELPHSVRVLFNGNYAGTMSFEKIERGTATFDIPANWIVAGRNVVTFRGELGEDDVSLVDWIRLTYPHGYGAESGALKLTAARGTIVTLTGFPSTSVRVFDVTDPRNVQRVPTSFGNGPGGTSVVISVPGTDGSNAVLLAVDESRVLPPASVVKNIPSRWNQDSSATNYWLIGHPSLLPSIAPLQQLRAGQGLKVKTVDVEDLYDEFSFGQKSPYAIRDFLLSRQSTGAARYALLVGGASFDPRNFLGMGERDFVPTKLVPEGAMKSAYDGWFAEASEEGLASMAVGRLPVRTPAELVAVVAKTLRWEAAVEAGEPWTRTVLSIADVNDPPGENSLKFETLVDSLADAVDPPFSGTTFKVGQVAGAPAQLRAALNAGPGIVTFAGHGSPDSWSKQRILRSEDALALTNTAQPSVFLSLNCLNGFFIDVYQDSLAEGLMKNTHGGAAAILASASLTEPGGQGALAIAFYEAVFGQGTVRLGDALAVGRAASEDLDVRKSFNLLGDPALRLR